MHEHSRMFASVAARLGIRRRVECSNPNLWTSLRTGGGRSALFIMNLFTSGQAAEIRCSPAGPGGVLNLGHHMLEPMTVKFLEL